MAALASPRFKRFFPLYQRQYDWQPMTDTPNFDSFWRNIWELTQTKCTHVLVTEEREGSCVGLGRYLNWASSARVTCITLDEEGSWRYFRRD